MPRDCPPVQAGESYLRLNPFHRLASEAGRRNAELAFEAGRKIALAAKSAVVCHLTDVPGGTQQKPPGLVQSKIQQIVTEIDSAFGAEQMDETGFAQKHFASHFADAQ